MSLRGKFQFLLAIFGVSIVANVLVSVWCISIYMDQATGRFHVLMTDMQRIDLIRGTLERLRSELEDQPDQLQPPNIEDYRTLLGRIAEQISQLPSSTDVPPGQGTKKRLLELNERFSTESERYLAMLLAGHRQAAATLLSTAIQQNCVAPMRKELGKLACRGSALITQTSADVHDKQVLVTAILAVNALVAFCLAAAGVHLVRNWVLKPVGALKTAAEKHAGGDLQYRIPAHSNDELGTLSRTVNRMADSLAVIQRRLLERERLAAIGEVASSVAHNIRNPLASIRASAQSSLKEMPEEGDIQARQVYIIETVDSLNRWLRELLMLNTPLELDCHTVVARTLVDRVVGVTRSAAERRGIRFEVNESPTGCEARVDASRVEQALLAVVDNAVEASPDGAAVRIAIRNGGGLGERVELRVGDSGPGIPVEIVDRIGSPYASTKPGGTGIGLYLAKRVVQAHGGEIEFQNNPDGGTTVTLHLPSGSVDEAASEAAVRQ